MLDFRVFRYLVLLSVIPMIRSETCPSSASSTYIQIERMEQQFAALTEISKNLAWAVMKTEMMFAQLKKDLNEENKQATKPEQTCDNSELLASLNEVVSHFKKCGSKESTNPEMNPTDTKTINSCKQTNKTGIYQLKLDGDDETFSVLCENDYENGGWLVIQHRFNGSTDFYRNWTDYKTGFGDVSTEFWLGNDHIHKLTKEKREIHFVMTDWDGKSAVAKYSGFQIGNEAEQYILKSLGSYSGTAGDSLSRNVNSKFTTRDVDNDSSGSNCANLYFGGWWYDNCHLSNLNGKYIKGAVSEYATMMCWSSFKGFNYGLQTAKIMIRV